MLQHNRHWGIKIYNIVSKCCGLKWCDFKMCASPVAGFCGYLAGKMSYMKTCQEKFKRLENSPLGEALRQRTRVPPQQWASHTPDSDTVCFYLPTTPWQFLCSPPQSQRCSVRAEWSRHPVIWNHVPASRSPKPEKLQCRITRPNGQIGWLQHSRQVADKLSFLPLLNFR